MRRLYRQSASAIALAGAAAVLSGGQAWGQAQAPAPAAPPSGAEAQVPASSQLQEVIVTARKRQESILNVPVIETALPRQQLQRFQTQDLKDIATLVPGLTIGDSVLSIGTQVSLRGVGTSSYDPGIDQSVSLNIDGLQLSQGLAYSSGLFDMAQVEVLEGPQSLFYGKSSPGGVIAIHTADPTDQVEVIGRAGYESEASEKQGDIIVSGPVTDTLRVRLAARYDAQDGFYDNVATGLPALGSRNPAYSHITPEHGYMIRATALWIPSSRFSARLKVNEDYDRTYYSGSAQLVNCPDGASPVTLAPGVSIPFISSRDDCRRDRSLAIVDMDPAAFPGITDNGTPYLETTQTYGTLDLTFQVTPGLTLTSTTGYYLLHSSSLLNTDETGEAAPLLAVTNGFHRREATEEVRLNSDFTGPLNFTAGTFLERGELTDLVDLLGNIDLGAPALLQKGMQTVDIQSDSAFAQLRWKLLPPLELAAGARYTDEERTDTAVDDTTGVIVPIQLAVPDIRSKTLSPEITLTYRPTADLTLFGALKRGFKSGSFNVATPPTPGENNAFGDEKVEGGEIGLKSRWLHRRLAFNIAAYDYRYGGLQVGAIIPVESGIPVERTLNAGAARVDGIEADAAYRPALVEGLGLHVSANWNHARFNRLDNVPCYGGQTIAQGCNENYSATANAGIGGFTATNESGLPLVRAPTWQINFGFDYQTVVWRGMTLIFASSTQYSSKYLTGLGEVYYQPEFFKTDLSATLQDRRDRWELAVIGKNLNNALTSGNCTNYNAQGGLLPGTEITGTNLRGPAGSDEVGCYMDRGRELWLRVTLKPTN